MTASSNSTCQAPCHIRTICQPPHHHTPFPVTTSLYSISHIIPPEQAYAEITSPPSKPKHISQPSMHTPQLPSRPTHTICTNRSTWPTPPSKNQHTQPRNTTATTPAIPDLSSRHPITTAPARRSLAPFPRRLEHTSRSEWLVRRSLQRDPETLKRRRLISMFGRG
ncbi:hypothetical protein M3J07_004071 [Ascochyta lentis]